jgi:undecaprenyl pyrophosphate phosphatase UppP
MEMKKAVNKRYNFFYSIPFDIIQKYYELNDVMKLLSVVNTILIKLAAVIRCVCAIRILRLNVFTEMKN